jgi:hypothetical protein
VVSKSIETNSKNEKTCRTTTNRAGFDTHPPSTSAAARSVSATPSLRNALKSSCRRIGTFNQATSVHIAPLGYFSQLGNLTVAAPRVVVGRVAHESLHDVEQPRVPALRRRSTTPASTVIFAIVNLRRHETQYKTETDRLRGRKELATSGVVADLAREQRPEARRDRKHLDARMRRTLELRSPPRHVHLHGTTTK